MIEGKTVLVTGGTGSFGHYIVKELANKKAKEIRVFSRDESKQDDMRHEYRCFDNLRFIIGDVRNPDSLCNAMKGVDIVFHAAALKQVPSCEYNVFEAIQTNVIGAKNLIEAAINENVEKVIAISTDKAVKPVNVMGMTKALQERLMIEANLNRNGCRTIFSVVRYGNVVGSRGSVIPLFKKQIEEGGSVKVTDPNMTRFILTMKEAVELVFKAVEESVGGEIFIRKIASVRIGDIAKVMLGDGVFSEMGEKYNVSIVGVRPGEKIHEVLISDEEVSRTIDLGKYYCIFPIFPLCKINDLRTDIKEYTSKTTDRYSLHGLRDIIKSEGLMPNVN